MNVAQIGMGIGVGAAVGSIGVAASQIIGRHRASADSKSMNADGFVHGVSLAMLGAGGLCTLAGRVSTGLRPGLMAAGAAMAGAALLNNRLFNVRTGPAVDSLVAGVMAGYDRNHDDAIQVSPSLLSPIEDTRHERRRRSRSRTYNIQPLAQRADTDRNGTSTSAEIRAAIAAYDRDGNGRLQGDELMRYEQHLGERSGEAPRLPSRQQSAAVAAPSSLLPSGMATMLDQIQVPRTHASDLPLRARSLGELGSPRVGGAAAGLATPPESLGWSTERR